MRILVSILLLACIYSHVELQNGVIMITDSFDHMVYI
jgi:hypothetical protein